MPYKNLTGQGKGGFSKLGQLRKGDKKTPKKPGKEQPWFRFAPASYYSHLAGPFRTEYGDKPVELEVLLPYPMIDMNWEAWGKEYGSGGLLHQCNGEYCYRWYDFEKREMVTDESMSKKKCPGGCNLSGSLKVVLPLLPALGYVEVVTSGKWDVVNIDESLTTAAELLATAPGRLMGKPFVLSRREHMTPTPAREMDDGSVKRTRQKKFNVHIELSPKVLQPALLQMQAGFRELTGEGPPQIATSDAPALVDFEDDDVIELEGGKVVEVNTGKVRPLPRPLADLGDDYPETKTVPNAMDTLRIIANELLEQKRVDGHNVGPDYEGAPDMLADLKAKNGPDYKWPQLTINNIMDVRQALVDFRLECEDA